MRNLLIAVALMVSTGAAGGERPTPRLDQGARRAYQLSRRTTYKLSIEGRTQKEAIHNLFDLIAKVEKVSPEGDVPVGLEVSRLKSSVDSRFKKAAIEIDASESDKSLPAHQLVPGLAFLMSPVRLLYKPKAGTVKVTRSADLQARVEELLKRDFRGTEEGELVRDAYVARASETELSSTWKNLLLVEVPVTADLEKGWKRTRKKGITACIPSESWMTRVELALEQRSSFDQRANGGFEIMTDTKVLPRAEPTSTMIGPYHWVYSVKEGSGSRRAVFAADGWALKVESTLNVEIESTLDLGDKQVSVVMEIDHEIELTRRNDERVSGSAE